MELVACDDFGGSRSDASSCDSSDLSCSTIIDVHVSEFRAVCHAYLDFSSVYGGGEVVSAIGGAGVYGPAYDVYGVFQGFDDAVSVLCLEAEGTTA